MTTKVLVAQPAPENPSMSPLVALAQKYDLDLTFKSFMEIEGVSVRDFRAYRVDILSYKAIFLTSKVAVDHLFRICEGLRIKMPETMRYYCASESIANYLQKYIVYRKRKILFAASIDELLELITRYKKDPILLPLSDSQKSDIAKTLDKAGFTYTKVIVYKTLSSDLTQLPINDYKIIVCYSASDIKSIKDNFPDYKQGDTTIACYGPSSLKAAKAAGFTVAIQAPKPNIPSMSAALEAFLKAPKKK